MRIMVKATLKAFEAKGVSTGSGNRFVEQPEHENMEQKKLSCQHKQYRSPSCGKQ